MKKEVEKIISDHDHTNLIYNWMDSSPSDYERYKKEFIISLKHQLSERSNAEPIVPKKIILTEVRKRKEELDNVERELDINLKKYTLKALFIFLAIETFIIFLFSFLQATAWIQFHLEEWSFKLLVAATISQITFMLQVAVKHLFPNKG